MSHKKTRHDDDNDGEKPVEAIDHPSYEALQQQLTETEQKANQYWERLLRMQADNDNAARRTEREVANAHKYALEKFVSELLPIVDSLELCATSVPENMRAAAQSVIEGVDLTLKMFYTALEKFGVVQINPVSEPFDPEFQQAISMQEDPKLPPGVVISVLQKGYTLNGRLVRPALVVVNKAKE